MCPLWHPLWHDWPLFLLLPQTLPIPGNCQFNFQGPPSHPTKGIFESHTLLCASQKKTLLPCSSVQAFVRLSSLMSNFLLSPDLIVFILAVLLIFPAVLSCYIELMFLNATEILGGAVLPENVEGEEDPGGYSVCLVRDAIIMTPEHSCHDTITSRTRSG